MGKKNKKAVNAKKEERDKNKDMLRIFTKASVFAMEKELRGLEVEDMFVDIYLKLDNDTLRYLNKEYEKQMLLAVMDVSRFGEGLNMFYTRMAEYIKKENLYRDFFELAYQIFTQLGNKKSDNKILNAYHDLLLQQVVYFTGSPAKSVCGLTQDGKLIITGEPGENLSVINYEYHKRLLRGEQGEDVILECFRKNGYPRLKNMNEAMKLIFRDQVLGNMYYYMTPVLNEETQDIIRKPHWDPTDLPDIPRIIKRDLIPLERIYGALSNREVLLPSEGVTATLYNCLELKEVYMREIFRGDSVILLWRIKTLEGSYISGYYDTQTSIFFTPWRDSTARDIIHDIIESIVLQQYLRLVVPIIKEQEKEYFQFEEMRREEEHMPDGTPRVYFSIREKSVKGDTHPRRHFDRKKYISDLINISPFLRNLPAGAVASEEALNKAKRLGIQLPPGKTLVSGFKRKTWYNPEKEDDEKKEP